MEANFRIRRKKEIERRAKFELFTLLEKYIYCNLFKNLGWTNMNYPSTMVNSLLNHKKTFGGAAE